MVPAPDGNLTESQQAIEERNHDMSFTYRPKEEVLKALNELKDELGEKTNTKVLDYVLLNFAHKVKCGQVLDRKVYQLK